MNIKWYNIFSSVDPSIMCEWHIVSCLIHLFQSHQHRFSIVAHRPFTVCDVYKHGPWKISKTQMFLQFFVFTCDLFHIKVTVITQRNFPAFSWPTHSKASTLGSQVVAQRPSEVCDVYKHGPFSSSWNATFLPIGLLMPVHGGWTTLVQFWVGDCNFIQTCFIFSFFWNTGNSSTVHMKLQGQMYGFKRV